MNKPIIYAYLMYHVEEPLMQDNLSEQAISYKFSAKEKKKPNDMENNTFIDKEYSRYRALEFTRNNRRIILHVKK
uniref:Uncharacterized protein n=1 Tax=Tetranychus urticae TaxID=32264 RepID=T1JPX6_TETUR